MATRKGRPMKQDALPSQKQGKVQPNFNKPLGGMAKGAKPVKLSRKPRVH